MTPQEFLGTIVHPTIHDAKAEPLSLRKIIYAVAVVDMLAAHLYQVRKDEGPLFWASGGAVKDDRGFREFLAERSGSFRLLRDIAKAQKHVRLEEGKNRTVTSASQVKPTSLGFGIGRFGEGPFGGTEQIVVEADDGSVRNVLALIGEAFEFLEIEFSQTAEEACQSRSARPCHRGKATGTSPETRMQREGGTASTR